MRAVFGAGVLHSFGIAGFDPFDLYIGVSAGACHLASHLAGQNDRNFDITLRYSTSPAFINLRRFLKGGHLIDLDWMWEQTITNYRLDLKRIDEKLRTQEKEYLVGVTLMETGEALYLRPGEDTLEHYLKVSSSMPILYRCIPQVDGNPATDGGMADSIPVKEAYLRGASQITVLRSRPASYIKKESFFSLAFFSWYFRRYPKLVETFKKREAKYNSSVEFIHHPPAGVRIREIAPPPDLGIDRTTQNEAGLRAAYETGIACGKSFIAEYGEVEH